MVHSPQKSIIVGIDGSTAAIRAAEWAATEAADRDIPLRLVYVAEPNGEDPVAGAPNTEFDYGRDALEAARRAVEHRDAVKVESELLHGKVDSTLAELSEGAEMVVVGSVGIGFFAEMILGSTASSLARTARCAVAIVRAPHRYAEVPSAGPIVVPIESRSPVDAVLGAAFFEGKIRAAEVMIPQLQRIRPWAVPASSTTVARGATGPLEDRVDTFRGNFPTVVAYSMLIDGYPIAYLEQLSKSAQLVVVGRRRQTGAEDAGTLDGTAHAMVYHAKCPVLVVPSIT
ncbi:universal stress protein [Antrihabitans sp. YC2-6]|uniref:universal stress protein n=1 Tax=Antrihabitans sp. YC2-6 TaxID=2799498 RepID=UPI0018F329E2|nr:universal stress protein [Antrihabitans sp. YC2-6]MBJ8346986.1 universal stress protein [Antrihabitans sp. YC2-6]